VAVDPERYKKIFGFIPSRQEEGWSLRANTLKISAEDLETRLQKYGSAKRMQFIREGFFVKADQNLSKTIEHSLGYFFLQSASSMTPPLFLDPKPTDTILDLCAAPGAKTTQIAALMQNQGAVVANDITYKRLKALRGNLQRCGVRNVVVTKMFGENFWKIKEKFNKILLDAPCTGTGSMNPRILQQTSEQSIRMLSNLQKRLLESASQCLEKNGTLIYSTCSLEPEENEENVDFAVSQLGLHTERVELKINYMPGLSKWADKKYEGTFNAIRVIPTNEMEGFFICKLRK
jgi:NOL1/NOP2/sun family putative RNA methylase